MKRITSSIIALLLLTTLPDFLRGSNTTSCQQIEANPVTGDLEKSFMNPPQSAKPWVFWFWMNGNVTKEGITADLEAMQQTGIGGTVMMRLRWYGPPPGKIDFNTPEWLDIYAHAANESKRLWLGMSLHQCDGYATAGGQWIKPSQGIKEIMWTIRDVDGSSNAPIRLEQPKTKLGFYEDVAVSPFPLPKNQQ